MEKLAVVAKELYPKIGSNRGGEKMVKAGYKYTETELLKSVRVGSGEYLIFDSGIWYELTEDGYCKYLPYVEAGRLLKTGIVEFPEEVTLEDISNAEKWALED